MSSVDTLIPGICSLPLRASWRWDMISSGVTSSKWQKKGGRMLFIFLCTALNVAKPIATTDLSILIFASSPSWVASKEKSQLQKDSVKTQRPPSQLLSGSSKLFDADTANFNSRQMHLWNAPNISIYKTLLQTHYGLAFTWYLGISDFTAASYLNNRKKKAKKNPERWNSVLCDSGQT